VRLLGALGVAIGAIAIGTVATSTSTTITISTRTTVLIVNKAVSSSTILNIAGMLLMAAGEQRTSLAVKVRVALVVRVEWAVPAEQVGLAGLDAPVVQGELAV
jgi:hypothetical protein